MAVIAPTITNISNAYEFAHIASWNVKRTSVPAELDEGSPVEMPGSADRTIQVSGVFGAGGTVIIEGSNDGTNYRTIHDAQGFDLSFTSAKVESVSEITRYIRPRITGGVADTTNLTVTMVLRRLT